MNIDTVFNIALAAFVVLFFLICWIALLIMYFTNMLNNDLGDNHNRLATFLAGVVGLITYSGTMYLIYLHFVPK